MKISQAELQRLLERAQSLTESDFDPSSLSPETYETIEKIIEIRAKYNITNISNEINCCKEELGVILFSQYQKLIGYITEDRQLFSRLMNSSMLTQTSLETCLSLLLQYQTEIQDRHIEIQDRHIEQFNIIKKNQREIKMLKLLVVLSIVFTAFSLLV